jgi:hypothetical protein
MVMQCVALYDITNCPNTNALSAQKMFPIKSEDLMVITLLMMVFWSEHCVDFKAEDGGIMFS